MRMPSEEAIDTAIAWLQCNEAGGQEQRACEQVAAYLDHMLDERYLRAAARRFGVPIARVRNKLAKLAEKENGP